MQDERAALKAIALARRHSLSGAAAGLARRLGMAAAQDGRPAAALRWMLLAHDPARAAELAAPLLAKVQSALLQRASTYAVAPLDMPELHELAPLLMSLPGQHGVQQLAAAEAAGAVVLHHQQQQQQQHAVGGGLLVVRPYRELHCLRALLQLLDALALISRAAAGDGADTDAAAAASLRKAYAAARAPAVELLLEGLAPAALRLPLLVALLPIIDNPYAPFSTAEVHALLRVLAEVSGDEVPAVAAAVLSGTHGAATALPWPSTASNDGAARLQSRHISDVRLALCRGLAHAHVSEASGRGTCAALPPLGALALGSSY